MTVKYSAGMDINGNVRNVIVNHTSQAYAQNDVFSSYDVEVHTNRTDLKALLAKLRDLHYTEV